MAGVDAGNIAVGSRSSRSSTDTQESPAKIVEQRLRAGHRHTLPLLPPRPALSSRRINPATTITLTLQSGAAERHCEALHRWSSFAPAPGTPLPAAVAFNRGGEASISCPHACEHPADRCDGNHRYQAVPRTGARNRCNCCAAPASCTSSKASGMDAEASAEGHEVANKRIDDGRRSPRRELRQRPTLTSAAT